MERSPSLTLRVTCLMPFALVGVPRDCNALRSRIAIFAVNIGKVLAHLVRPRIEPLTLKPAVQGNV